METKIKISQKEFDTNYEIDKEITEETLDVPSAKQEDTTPEFLTEEEIENEKDYLKDFNIPNIEEEDGK